MPVAFHAAVVRVRKEQWGFVTLLSVDADLAAERYLMIQRKAAPSPDDERFGMNDVYIETCGQGWYPQPICSHCSTRWDCSRLKQWELAVVV